MTSIKQNKNKESFFNLHFTSTVSISLVLFMIGLILSLYLTTNSFAKQSKENISMSVILNDTIQQKDLERLERYLKATEYTKEVIYISRDSALREHINAIGEDPSEFLGYNPLSASLEVYLKAEFANVDSISQVILPRLKVFEGISEVTYQKDILEKLTSNVKKLSLVFSIIALIMLFISVVLINNTIRISIYSKRFIINTMQLVGAQNSFIRRPFINRSIINSIIASIIAICILYGAFYVIQYQIGHSFDLFRFGIIMPVVISIFAISLIINYLATVAAVNRYLKMNTEQLYFI